jgi:GTP cyclohydrolase I
MKRIPVNPDSIALLEETFRGLLHATEPGPLREGLRDTPARAAAAWSEWCSGYAMDPAQLLKSFDDGAESYDSLVIVHRIPITSLCEHHLAPITGYAHVGYLPGGRIAGLSKLARVVDAYARRLQVQERLTVQIADCVHDTLGARATGVLIRASHGCMSTRGIRAHDSVTTTSALRGLLKTESALREEFMSLCLSAEK